MTERWLPVVGFESSYEVSDRGRVRSLDRTITQGCRWGGTMLKFYKGRQLKVHSDDRGRRYVSLWELRAVRRRTVSALVAAAFLGPRPHGMEVCHCDGDNGNDALANLRYDTRVGNEADKRLHGTHLYGERSPAAKLTEEQVQTILTSGQRGVDLARTFGVTPAAVSAIRTGKNWRHV